MRRLSKQLIILMSGTFLMVGVATADSDRNSDRGRKFEDSFRDCGNSRNCRPSNNREARHDRDDNHRYRDDRDDNRRYRDDRDDNRRYRHDNNRRQTLSHYHDNKSKARVELRISTYPVYINTDRRPHYVRSRPPSRVITYDYRPYYYRDYGLSSYPGRPIEYAPRGNVIYWNDNSSQVSAGAQYNGQHGEGQYCREYSTDSIVQGRPQQVYGTACLQPDGSWKIIN